MNHDFHHQQIGAIEHVPRAAISETLDQFFQHVDMQLHRLPS
jgi:hypothetical protein